MPNWCNNWTHFRHSDKAQLERLQKAASEDRLFSEFVPNPAGPNADDWYEHNISNWGTKWDTSAASEHPIEYDSDTGLYTLSISFDTAWSPPLRFYDNLLEQGWDVDAYYFEPGMNFCGKWSNGYDDHYEIPETAEEAEEQLPEDLEEVFDICQMLWDRQEEEEWEEEDEESDKR